MVPVPITRLFSTVILPNNELLQLADYIHCLTPNWLAWRKWTRYCPQRSCGKVMFFHLFVILFTGVVAATPSLGRSPRQTPPWSDTPPAQCMLGYGQRAGGTHPTGMHYLWFWTRNSIVLKWTMILKLKKKIGEWNIIFHLNLNLFISTKICSYGKVYTYLQ